MQAPLLVLQVSAVHGFWSSQLAFDVQQLGMTALTQACVLTLHVVCTQLLVVPQSVS